MVFIAVGAAMDHVGAPRGMTGQIGCAAAAAFALMGATYWAPAGAASYLLLFCCIAEYDVPGFASWTLFFMLYALSMLAYSTTTAVAVLIMALFDAYTLVEHLVMPSEYMTWYTVFAFALFAALMTTLGCFLRWNDERTRQLRAAMQARHELSRMRENQLLAGHLHDAICHKLVVISLLAQNHRDPRDAEHDDYGAIERQAYDALQDMRALIGMLSETGDENDDAPDDAQLQDWIERNDAVLHRTGLSGRTVVDLSGMRTPPDDETLRTTRTLLREVYTNTMKHADRDHDYRIGLTIDDDAIDIDYANAVKDDPGRKLPGGYGLRGIDDIVRRRHGSHVHERDRSRWHGHIRIPLHEPPERRSPRSDEVDPLR